MRRWLIRHDIGVDDWRPHREWTFCERCDTPARFLDESDAYLWLRGFDMEELRRAIDDLGPTSQVEQLDDADLLTLLAAWLVGRYIFACPGEKVRRRPGGGGFPPAPRPPAPSPPPPAPVALHWIEIMLDDTLGNPVPGEAYRVELPGGEVREGTLNGDGRAYIPGIAQAGTCKVSFPNIDAREWRRA